MSSGDGKYSTAHTLGGVSIPRNINARIRASIRREDPDANPEPHYTGLAGTALNIDVSPVGALAVNFITDDLDDALALINAASPAALFGFEEDGYLVLQNLSGGGKNYLEITSGDAAPILGFVVSPEPGYKSFAGEITTAPPGRYKDQNNPQGTALIAGDEDLTSSSLNRAISGGMAGVARTTRDLDVMVPSVKDMYGIVITHTSGKKVLIFQEPSLRIPINSYRISGTTQANREMDTIVQILSLNDEPIIDISQDGSIAAPRYARVLDIYAGPAFATLDNSSSVADFHVDDGKSIFGPGVSDLDVQIPTAISQIRGDLIIALGATFITSGTQPGDTAVVESATNTNPFSHDGEFIVTEVLTETIIAVRPKSKFENTFLTSEKPTSLNYSLPGGTNYGTVRTVVGDYYSAVNGVALELPSWMTDSTSIKCRIISGVRFRDMPQTGIAAQTLVKSQSPNQGSLLKEFKDHIIDAVVGRRHAATDVDAPALVGSPDSLTVGTVEEQLAELLGHLNSLIAGNVAYGGGVAWADGTLNPATDLESQVDKILNDLVGSTGAAKIFTAIAPIWSGGVGARPAERLDERIDGIISDLASSVPTGGTWRIGSEALPNWADLSSSGAAGSLYEQLVAIIEALATGSGTEKIAQAAGDNWADGTVNGAETLGQRINNMITLLAEGDGADKIHVNLAASIWNDGSAGYLAGTLGSAIDYIVGSIGESPGGSALLGSADIGTFLSEGSIADQLLEIDVELVKLRAFRRKSLPIMAARAFQISTPILSGAGNWSQQVVSLGPTQFCSASSKALFIDVTVEEGDVFEGATLLGTTSGTAINMALMELDDTTSPALVVLASAFGTISQTYGTGVTINGLNVTVTADKRLYMVLWSNSTPGSLFVQDLQINYKPGGN